MKNKNIDKLMEVDLVVKIKKEDHSNKISVSGYIDIDIYDFLRENNINFSATIRSYLHKLAATIGYKKRQKVLEKPIPTENNQIPHIE